jgi:Family of unknown function (DUF5335)
MKEELTMSTREILRDQWVEFFQSFTDDHNDGLVRIGLKGVQPKQEKSVMNKPLPEKKQARELHLRGISADLKDHENTVTVTVGVAGDKLLRHEVQTVAHVRLLQTDEGTDTGVQIESVNGQMTTVRLSALT